MAHPHRHANGVEGTMLDVKHIKSGVRFFFPNLSHVSRPFTPVHLLLLQVLRAGRSYLERSAFKAVVGGTQYINIVEEVKGWGAGHGS